MSQGCMVMVGMLMQMAAAGTTEGTVWNRLPPDIPPALGCWFWHAEDLADRHYRNYVDMIARHSGFTHLTTSLRIPQGELTDDFIHDSIADAAEYARAFGIGVVMDLDVRLAREAFQRAYPNELQEMLRIREAARAAEGDTVLSVAPERLSDHYTGKAKPYVSVSSRLIRVYAFARGAEGILPETVADITAACRVEESTDLVIRLAVPAQATTQPVVCMCVAFSHLTPDAYAPHLLSFQRELLQRYAGTKLAGACKDEWGFPPCFDGTPAHNDFWYSEPMAAAYRARTGRDLVRDCLLMYTAETGHEADRQGAVNHYMEMNRQRHVEIEGDFYQAVKEIFGSGAMVATHPTWYPFCDRREFKKNGLDWWAARRDYAQTDEITPFCARTALAKKWNQSVWYNMFYAPEKAQYETAIWSHTLAGGRVNFHPLYPTQAAPGWSMKGLFTGKLMRGEARVRLLNFIGPAPLDCRVAVIFGHACAMNWAGPSYEDVGLGVVEPLWRAGYYTDLIPSSEIESGALRLDGGYVAYGSQRYDVAVLYHPKFEKPVTGDFFRQAAGGQTELCRVGEWNRDFDGKPCDGSGMLPPAMHAYPDATACLAAVLETMSHKAEAQTPAVDDVCWHSKIVQPPRAGHCRLVDGTRIIVAGQNDPAGDPIQATLDIDGHHVTFDAIGVAAVRLAADGRLEAMAAGGLKHFTCGGTTIDLGEALDLALWQGADGTFHGVAEDNGSSLPATLTSLTNDWTRLATPVPLPEE